MVESPSTPSPGHVSDADVIYRAIDSWAVGALLLGVIAPLAMLAPILWLLPPLGIFVATVALRRLRSNSERGGRAAALVGLALSVLFGIAPVAKLAADYLILPGQARPVADQWFKLLRERSPEKALMLQFLPEFRRPCDDQLWSFLRNDGESKRLLLQLVASPVPRVLLELGDRAHVRYYGVGGAGSSGSVGQVILVYTVTFEDDDGKTKTFFVNTVLERASGNAPALNPWRVSYSTAVDPRDRPQ